VSKGRVCVREGQDQVRGVKVLSARHLRKEGVESERGVFAFPAMI